MTSPLSLCSSTWSFLQLLGSHVSLLLPTTLFRPTPPASTPTSSFAADDLLLRRVFQLIDSDCDGLLTPSELHHHLCKLGLMHQSCLQDEFESLTLSTVLPTKHLQFHDFKLLYQALCKTAPPAAVEETGQYSSSCYEAACNGLHSTTEESSQVGDEHVLPEAFAVFDVNGDGKISVEELRQVLVRMGFKECENEAFCDSIMSTFDSNSDGYIDFIEFCVMMNNA